jgi:hypothetical protein
MTSPTSKGMMNMKDLGIKKLEDRPISQMLKWTNDVLSNIKVRKVTKVSSLLNERRENEKEGKD